MIGPTLSPDKARGWKRPIKVANAPRQRAAAKARASPGASGRRQILSAASDPMPGLTSDSDGDSSDSDSDDDSSDSESGDEERKDDLGAKITVGKLQTTRKKVGPHATLIRQLNWGLLQKTQIRKMPSFPVVARTPFWSFCAGQRRIGPGQITDGT